MIRQCKGPGKFEGEDVLTLFAYNSSLDGDGETAGDDHGGGSYTLLNGPWPIHETRDTLVDDEYGPLNIAERRFLAQQAGCILHESTQGFVTATWFEDGDELTSAWEDVTAVYCCDSEED